MIGRLMAGIFASQLDLCEIRTAIRDENWMFIVLCGWKETDVCDRALNTRALNRFPRKKSRDGRWFAGSGSEVEIR
jgi:hypothetical protein